MTTRERIEIALLTAILVVLCFSSVITTFVQGRRIERLESILQGPSAELLKEIRDLRAELRYEQKEHEMP